LARLRGPSEQACACAKRARVKVSSSPGGSPAFLHCSRLMIISASSAEVSG
jgi:hypothetical protein